MTATLLKSRRGVGGLFASKKKREERKTRRGFRGRPSRRRSAQYATVTPRARRVTPPTRTMSASQNAPNPPEKRQTPASSYRQGDVVRQHARSDVSLFSSNPGEPLKPATSISGFSSSS